MKPLNIIAFLVAVAGLFKTIVIITRPKAWTSFIKKYFRNPPVTMCLSFFAAVIILKFLLDEMTIVQIFAAMALMMALGTMGLAAYSSEVVEFSEKLLRYKRVINKAWPIIAVWMVLVVWVLVALFT